MRRHHSTCHQMPSAVLNGVTSMMTTVMAVQVLFLRIIPMKLFNWQIHSCISTSPCWTTWLECSDKEEYSDKEQWPTGRNQPTHNLPGRHHSSLDLQGRHHPSLDLQGRPQQKNQRQFHQSLTTTQSWMNMNMIQKNMNMIQKKVKKAQEKDQEKRQRERGQELSSRKMQKPRKNWSRLVWRDKLKLDRT